MQVSQNPIADFGRSAISYPDGVAAAAAALNDTTGSVGLNEQLVAYHALSTRWGGAGHVERAALAQVLVDSPFAKTVQSALNTFTRAAWAGTSAVPPAPQRQALEAFDGLSETAQTIVASLQVGLENSNSPSSVSDYRGRLQADLDQAQAPAARPMDTITLSAEAQARLAGGASADASPAAPENASPEMAVAINAYGKAAR
jgi:hypothetical protein